MRHLLISFFAVLFCFSFVSCHDDDDKEILKLFTLFAKSDTCFTATVKIWSSDGVVNGYGSVDLTFDIDEKTCGEDLQFWIPSMMYFRQGVWSTTQTFCQETSKTEIESSSEYSLIVQVF